MAAHQAPVPGILQARVLEWIAIAFSNAWKWKVKVKSLSHVRLFMTPWTAAYQAPPSMGFSRQEYWHIKKQRHYFANKGPSTQSYGFSSSQTWVPPALRAWTLSHWITRDVPKMCILYTCVCICGEGNGTPLQPSCLGNPMDGGAW